MRTTPSSCSTAFCSSRSRSRAPTARRCCWSLARWSPRSATAGSFRRRVRSASTFGPSPSPTSASFAARCVTTPTPIRHARSSSWRSRSRAWPWRAEGRRRRTRVAASRTTGSSISSTACSRSIATPRRRARLVGLAAEVEARHEQVANVFLARDLAPEVVVEIFDPAGAVAVVVEPLAAAHRLHHRGLAVLLRQREQVALIESRRVRVLEALPVALLPVADPIGVERASPAHAALQEREVQLGVSACDAAEEDGLGHGLAGGGEVADVVVAEVRRRVAQQDRARAVVEARRDAQLPQLLPDGLVVMLAVDGDRVVPLNELRGLGVLLDEGGDGSANEAAHHDDPQAELLRCELELLDRFLG